MLVVDASASRKMSTVNSNLCICVWLIELDYRMG